MRDDGGAPVAVVTAIREELEAVAGVARDVRSESGGLLRARIGVREVVMAATGDGPASAERAAAALCEAVRPSALIGSGIAGGLTGDLVVFDLIASARVFADPGELPPPDPDLLARAARAGAKAGSLVTVDAPVVSPSGRRRLAARLAPGEAGAVDMESAAWARAAVRRQVPYLVVRAISDTSEESLPEFFADCVGASGGIDRRAVAWRALGHPSDWPALLRLRRRVRACGRTLASFLERFFAEPE